MVRGSENVGAAARIDPRRVAVLFALGALVGTLGDRIHTYTGVLFYPHPVAFGEAWWVPLLMGAAGVLFVDGYRPFARRFGDDGAGSNREVATTFAWFAAAYLASGFYRDYPVALCLAFFGAFVARALRPPVSRAVWAYCVWIALGGTLWEAGLSATGAFTYARPNMATVPMWLPGLYLHCALFSRAVYRRWPPS